MDDDLQVAVLEQQAAAILPRRGGMADIAAAVGTRFGVGPLEVGRFTAADGLTLVRTAPHQLLAVWDSASDGWIEDLTGALDGVAGVVDLSDARSAVRIGGAAARTALSQLLPINPRALQAGSAASTIAGHIGVTLLQRDDAPTYELLCASSFGGAMRRMLELALPSASGNDHD